jgi:hypothetical protein
LLSLVATPLLLLLLLLLLQELGLPLLLQLPLVLLLLKLLATLLLLVKFKLDSQEMLHIRKWLIHRLPVLVQRIKHLAWKRTRKLQIVTGHHLLLLQLLPSDLLKQQLLFKI